MPNSVDTQSVVLGWCFDSVKIIGKVVSLSNQLRNQGLEPVWITRGRETQVALLAHGFLAHSISRFSHFAFPEQYLPNSDCQQQLDYIVEYDRISQRRLVELPGPEGMYYDRLARFSLGFWAFMIDFYQPKLCINLNGHPSLSRALAHLCSKLGLSQYYWENGLLPNTLVVDKEGVNYSAHLSGPRWKSIHRESITLEQRKTVENYRNSIISRGVTLVQHGHKAEESEIRSKLGIADQKILLVPMQVDSDTNIQFYSPLFKSMTSFVDFVMRAAQGHDDWILIFKEHPKRSDAQSAQIRKVMKHNTRLVTDIDLTSLLDVADATACINSTVGLESLIRRVPTCAFGQSTYSEKGLTYDLYREKSPLNALAKFLTRHPNPPHGFESEFPKFLYHLLSSHLLATSKQDPFQSQKRFAQQFSISASKDPEARNSDHLESALVESGDILHHDRELLARFREIPLTTQQEFNLKGLGQTGSGKALIRALEQRFPQSKVKTGRSSWLHRLAPRLKSNLRNGLTLDFGRPNLID